MSEPRPPAPKRPPPIPGLVHLSGSRRGTTEMLTGEILRLGSAADTEIHLPADREPAVAPHHAILHRRGKTFQLRVEPGQVVRVNGGRVDEIVLASGDVLEIGEGGPRLRFRLYKSGTRAYKTMMEAFTDCVDCARVDGSTPLGRAGSFLKGAPRELAQTSPGLRGTLVALVTVLAVATMALFIQSVRLERQLRSEHRRVDGIAELMASQEELTLEDIRDVRSEVADRLSGTLERLEALEARAEASRRTVAAAAESVVFLQGAYGFLDAETGLPLRFVLGTHGGPVFDSDGVPLITAEGDGPLIESYFTGTGFVVDGGGLLTNRHVARPWEEDETAQGIVGQGYQPSRSRFLGYLPGAAEPVDLELVAVHPVLDLALLRWIPEPPDAPALSFADEPVAPGDEVIVLGYPTGIRALLARTDEAFMNELMNDQEVDFWKVTKRLAEAGHIEPLATRGIVGQVSPRVVVYDANTTSGGSGGPVLNLRGGVVAVNAAILLEFSGANQGVPIAAARELLAPPEPDLPDFVPSIQGIVP